MARRSLLAIPAATAGRVRGGARAIARTRRPAAAAGRRLRAHQRPHRHRAGQGHRARHGPHARRPHRRRRRARSTFPPASCGWTSAATPSIPGLIDAATSIGLPSPTREVAAAAPVAPRRGGAADEEVAAARRRRRGVPALARAAATPPPPVVAPGARRRRGSGRHVLADADELKAFRAGGVTTVGLVFNGGSFPGRVGAALTGTRDESRIGAAHAASARKWRSARSAAALSERRASARTRSSASRSSTRSTRRGSTKRFKAGTPGARPSNDPFTPRADAGGRRTRCRRGSSRRPSAR